MFKIVKKTEVPPLQSALLRVFAAVYALLSAAVIMAAIGHNPVQVYSEILKGAVGSAYRFRETINKGIPLVVLSLGIAVAFRMKFWNIGAEGQFYMGAYGASLIALFFPGLPIVLMLVLMSLAAIAFGGVWSLIPAFLRIKFGTSETLITLMLNYVAIRWITYLQYGPWKDPAAGGMPKIARFPDAAVLPKLFGVHIGWIIALVLVAFIYVLMKSTKLGYEIAVLGENLNTARYAGMNVTKIVLVAIIISGGLCGMAGMMQASAIEHSLSYQLSGGLGFTAIITAWLAHLNPILIVVVSFLFAILLQGGAYIQSALQIPAAVALMLQGIILFFVLGSEFFLQYSIVSKKKLEKQATEKTKGERSK